MSAICRPTAGQRTRYLLDESAMPTHWYNLAADLPEPPPRALHASTFQPLTPDDMTSLCARELMLQDAPAERFVEIPDEVLRVYRMWRPSPLVRALNLERRLGTPARVYYKYEGLSPTGSHKPNTAVAQAYYNAERGIRRLTTETGAAQWGTALAFACSQFGLECEVFWAGGSHDQKPARKTMMEAFGATVHRSPSPITAAGRKAIAEDPDTPGSIGLAVSEAVEVALADPDSGYALGSAVNHVLLHQTVIGEEALRQFALAEDFPDVVISCVGGGSSIGGVAFPFLRARLEGRPAPRVLAVEPTACPALTRGRYVWDYGDKEGLTPLMKMHTVGHAFVPDPIHAGGLRYHGMTPIVSFARHLGLIEATALPQTTCFAAGVEFLRAEGVVAAPEATHAIAAGIDEALRCKQTGQELTIFVLVTGHGLCDLPAYELYLSGGMEDFDLSDEYLAASLASIPDVPVHADQRQEMA